VVYYRLEAALAGETSLRKAARDVAVFMEEEERE
jgi:hypothetical protein